MEEGRTKKKRAPAALLISCTVCGAPAPDHLHFGGHCCYSCRAFFRRTIERMEKTEIVCRTGLNDCEVSEMSKSCSACRYEKCLTVGMSTHLLQGKRKKKDNKPDDPPSKAQKVIGEIPELEMIPRYSNLEDNKRFSMEMNPTNYLASNLRISPPKGMLENIERRKYQQPFPLFHKEKIERKEDRIFKNSTCSSFLFPPDRNNLPRFEPGSNTDSPTFESRSGLNMTDEILDYNQHFSRNDGDFGRILPGPYPSSISDRYVIQRKENSKAGPPPPLMNRNPSVIQGQYRSPNQSVIRSARTSVIQHGQLTAPKRSIEVEQGARLTNYPIKENFPIVPSCNSSKLLRYEANMMKYQADLCKQRSQVLDSQARFLEQQDQARKTFVAQFLPRTGSTALPQAKTWNNYNKAGTQLDENTRIKNFDQEIFDTRKTPHSDPNKLSAKPLIELQDSHASVIIKTENIDDEQVSTISDDVLLVKERQEEEEVPNSEGDKDQQLYLRQDIKQLFAELIYQARSNPGFDSTVFQSKVFLEADDLLSNSPLRTLLKTMSFDSKKKVDPKMPGFSHENVSNSSFGCKTFQNSSELRTEPPELIIKVEKDMDEENKGTKELKSVIIPQNVPELSFTSEEMDWVDKIQQTMAICTKSVIREAVYQAVIDNWAGEITHCAMLEIIAKGKARQAYMHILIMSNLPYFQDLSSRAQRWLMKSAAAVGMELMTAVFFFAHNSETIIEQAETCGLATNFKKYIETKAPYALKMPARSYESLYKSPWAETIEDEIRHRRGQQLVGESLKGKDPRIMPLLYALAFYAVSENDIAEMDLPETDKTTIKKAQEHLGVIYRRFLKQQHGWKAATGYALSHIYYLSVLKENVSIGFGVSND
eukprot:GFUD01030051.1.p1 GENE.GFUD01030051.1~~GFUD01030051.1.p1  ORF type:complete len:877 (+),score=166.00 GFUD01030051.1:322-2952(+)